MEGQGILNTVSSEETWEEDKVRSIRKKEADGCSKLITLTKARNGIETRDRIGEHSTDNNNNNNKR